MVPLHWMPSLLPHCLDHLAQILTATPAAFFLLETLGLIVSEYDVSRTNSNDME